MADRRGNLAQLPEPKSEASGGGNGGGNRHGERIAALETHIQYLATKKDVESIKTDVQSIKVWVLLGVITGIVIALGLMLTYHKYFIATT